jgi:tRNA(adenine34) deaminase
MVEALLLAGEAAEHNEVPVGAVIAMAGKIIGRGRNRMEELCCATAHAEMLAIQEASHALGSWRLNESVLVVTLEPCTMCAGAIVNARIPTVVFATREPNTGALRSLFDVTLSAPPAQRPRIIEGIMENESRSALQRFFLQRRTDERA